MSVLTKMVLQGVFTDHSSVGRVAKWRQDR